LFTGTGDRSGFQRAASLRPYLIAADSTNDLVHDLSVAADKFLRSAICRPSQFHKVIRGLGVLS
jgi:hypothetical protein